MVLTHTHIDSPAAFPTDQSAQLPPSALTAPSWPGGRCCGGLRSQRLSPQSMGSMAPNGLI